LWGLEGDPLSAAAARSAEQKWEGGIALQTGEVIVEVELLSGQKRRLSGGPARVLMTLLRTTA